MHGYTGNSNFLRKWNLEAKNKENDIWNILSEHNNDITIKKRKKF